ncbi:hypothetical protein E3N88_04669 [Mikania micrantha]|uniref:Uncharacterized protein n=1 Tax=Mikania micrantha TaxID=192012 RepID=A0A5N6PX53_9ASTR|nr:hypothetical protein E3N88_04669 [Mikania micrantha]
MTLKFETTGETIHPHFKINLILDLGLPPPPLPGFASSISAFSSVASRTSHRNSSAGLQSRSSPQSCSPSSSSAGLRSRKKSKIAKSNCDKGNNDKAARHTGGSIGYDEYRARMASYLEEMIKKNGLEFSVDDPHMWSRVVEPNLKRTRRVYGIGSSDINYVVNGITTSSSGVTQSDTEHLSQKKIHDLEVQIEAERRSRLELEEEIRKERQERLEMQLQMKEFLKFIQRPDG